MTADAEVRKTSDGRWQVNYWMPERFHGPASVSAKSKPTKTKKVALGASKKTPRNASSSSSANPNQALIGGIWWALPIALLSLIILAPLTLLIVGLIRNRREAARDALGT